MDEQAATTPAPTVSAFAKWSAFFSPVSGWKDRFLEFKSGRRTWAVPGKPDFPEVVPFPVEWVPHTFDEAEFDDKAREIGFKFIDVVCCETGKPAPAGVGVLCLRCGIPLHPTAAGMIGGFDPPVCKRCSWILIFYK